MSKEANPPTNYHLNRYQFHAAKPWVPYPTRDEQLAQQRHMYPGTLIPSQQARSLRVAEHVVNTEYGSAAEQQYANLLIARSFMGAAAHSLVTDRMYSVLKLARLADGDPKNGSTWYETREGLQNNVAQQLAWSAQMGELFLESKRADNPELSARRGWHVGKFMGNTALSVIMLDTPDRIRGQHPYDVRMHTREQTMTFVEEVGDYAQDIGVLPSVAQLVEPDSPLAVDIRRHAPTSVLKVYEAALKEFPEQIAA